MEEAKKFKELYEMTVEGNVDKKQIGKDRNGNPIKLSYLSWPYAWATLIEQDPSANYKVYERPDGRLYWDDGKTAWVKVSVTMFNKEVIEYLAIMDDSRANASMPLNDCTITNKYGEEVKISGITSFDVGKAIQRAMVKAIARFGIGLKLYAGEDLPSEEPKGEPEKQEAKPPKSSEVPDLSKIQEILKGLDVSTSAKFVDWCVAKFGMGPMSLTDPKNIKFALVYLQAAVAKLQKDKPLTVAGKQVTVDGKPMSENVDDDLPF